MITIGIIKKTYNEFSLWNLSWIVIVIRESVKDKVRDLV